MAKPFASSADLAAKETVGIAVDPALADTPSLLGEKTPS